MAEAAQFLDHGATVEGEGTWRHVDAVHRGKRVARRDADDVLSVLHLLENVLGLEHGHGGRRGGDLRAVERADDLFKGVRRHERVRIEAADKLRILRNSNARIDRGVLAAILLMEHGHLGISLVPVHHLLRVVGGAVVYEDDLKLFLRVVEREE